MKNAMTLSEELRWRGFVNQTTLPDLKVLDKKKVIFYHGFDASANSQTIGNLAAMMFDKVFMRHGHRAVILAGGATSLIGDPGGKDKERVLQDEKTVAKNVDNAEEQLKTVFKGYDFKLVNNLDWFKDMTVIEFLRDIGKNFSMTPLVQRDYIAKRMGRGGAGISYTEFSYTLLQGYDFLYLHNKYGVDLQVAGSDQWGNCISGVDLVRRETGHEVHAITMPLIINQATGKKFGKSEDGAVWLDPKLTSPYDFYQFWLNVDDKGIESYLKVYTELPKPEIDKIMAEFKKDKSSRIAQKTLAYEVTKLIHGDSEAEKQSLRVVFGANEYNKFEVEDFKKLEAQLKLHHFRPGVELVPVMVSSGLASSNTEARRFITDGAVYINGQKAFAGKTALEESDYIHGYLVLRRGKNSQVLIKR